MTFNFFIIIIVLQSCLPASTQPPFKIEIPFEDAERGIIIDTYWGAGKVKHRMLWDNHSPTWVNESVVRGNRSINRAKGTKYRTSTADGKKISGDVYTCDKVAIGDFIFGDVNVYAIAGKNAGAIGENIISRGIWKIDRYRSMLTFTSSLDSLGPMENVHVMPATFSDTGITIQATIGPHKIQRNLQIDFGFNSGILLTSKDFAEVTEGKEVLYGNLQFSTPGQSTPARVGFSRDSIEIGTRGYVTILSSSEHAHESLIGYRFFTQFRYVILDYVSKRVYVAPR